MSYRVVKNTKRAYRAIPIYSLKGFERRNFLELSDGETVSLEQVCSGEWLDWYRLSPLHRLNESQKLWSTYFALGGLLDTESDQQSDFNPSETSSAGAVNGRPGLRVIRRSGI